MKNMRLYGFKNVVNNKYIMYTITTLLLISILTVGVIRNVKADSQHNYNKSFISIEIKEGDTLYRISRKYRISLDRIMEANPYVDVYNLRPGQEICIPMPCGSGPIAGRGMQQENVETTEQETDDEEYEEEQTAQSEEEKEASCCSASLPSVPMSLLGFLEFLPAGKKKFLA